MKTLDDVFGRFGVPKRIVSENSTMFTGQEFKYYCQSLAMEYITTPIYNPQSNGQAEMIVDTFKRELKRNNNVDTEEKSIKKIPNNLQNNAKSEY